MNKVIVPRRMASLLLGALISIQTAQVWAQVDTGLESSLRAQVVPVRFAVISAEMDGRVNFLPWREGDQFKKGRVLTEFECRKEKAELSRSVAKSSLADRELGVAERLDQLGTTSVLKLAKAKSVAEQFLAEAKIAQVLIQRCAVKAPFSGRVAELFVRPYQFVARGERLMRIIDPGRLEIQMIVPSRWLTWLRPGHKFELYLDETGRDHPAKVSSVAAWIDPVSQSLKIKARFTQFDSRILSGMSGRAKFKSAGGAGPKIQ